MIHRIAITGGRHYGEPRPGKSLEKLYAQQWHIWKTLGDLAADHEIEILMDGECPTGGADRLAHEWAVDNGVPTKRFRVDHGLDGPWPHAGPRRSRRMLLAGRPTLLVAFPGGDGTKACVDMARKLGIEIHFSGEK